MYEGEHSNDLLRNDWRNIQTAISLSLQWLLCYVQPAAMSESSACRSQT